MTLKTFAANARHTVRALFTAKSHVALAAEPPSVSRNASVATVQRALAAAETGDTRTLFSLYRDMCLGGSHVQAELNKRKLAVLGQPPSIQPHDKTDSEDLHAAVAVQAMIDACENWDDGLAHLLDATLWPVAVCEKILGVVPTNPNRSLLSLRFFLRRLEPVHPAVLCFKQPLPVSPTQPASSQKSAWEPDLRFYRTDPNGRIRYSIADSSKAEPDYHLVHRGHLLVGTRDCWGGPMRAILFWWLLSGLARDWFARFIERYGAPFPVAKADTSDQGLMKFLEDSLSLSTRIGGLIVPHSTEIQLVEAASSRGADAYERFIGVCNREISKLILGQTLSAEAQPTGLGSSVGRLQGEVRDDIRLFDQLRLGQTLRRQLFAPFLRINGLRGHAPRIVWGGQDPAEALGTANMLLKLSQAGLEPADHALPNLSERLGIPIRRKISRDQPQALE